MRKFCFLLCVLPSLAFAQDWGTAQIIDGGVLKSGEHIIGLEIDLNDGWKTYYKDPGQFGLAPLIEMTQGAQSVEPQIFWPEPHLFLADDLPSVGYKGKVIVPMIFEAKSEAPVIISADIGACETICVPAQLEFSLEPNAGYSFEQVALLNGVDVRDAEICEWSDGQIRAILERAPYAMVSDGNQSTIFSNWEEFASHYNAPYDLKLYALAEETVEPQVCP